MAEATAIENQMQLLKQIYKLRKRTKTNLSRNTIPESLEVSRSPQSPRAEESCLSAPQELDQKLTGPENDLSSIIAKAD